MGKAQSKRSVDITTETNKVPDGGDEVTGKLEKIEDIDQKPLNGDATPQEKNDAAGEKKDAPDETENEKDLTTEKTAAENTATPSPTDGGDQANTTAPETSPKEDAGGDGAEPGSPKEGEEITPLADESLSKKSKKKKWSFRSISFGKKDKQKPAKAEGSENAAGVTPTAENSASATNGNASETNKTDEGAVANETKKDEMAPAVAAVDEVKPIEGEKVENGVATEKEQHQMNGQKTPTPTDDAEEKKPIETSTIVVNETATVVATTAATSPAQPTCINDTTANESHSEMKAAVAEKIEAIVSNGTVDAEKNGDVHADEHDKLQHEENTTAKSEDNNKSIPVDEKPHQNGTNGDEGVEEITAATKTLQIEVKTEHQIDSVNSTTTTTTTTTTIPADNFNFEQKTTNDNLLTTSVQTDIHTTTNTSDKSFSSNNSIAITEEQSDNHPNTILDTVEEISKVAVEAEPAEINPIASNEDAETPQQPQQQPPPLPLSAPPSQVIIFALKDNENNSDALPPLATEIPVANNTENDLMATSEDISTSPLVASSYGQIEVIETEETTETKENVGTIPEPIETTIEGENPFCLSEEIEVELNHINLPVETVIVESIVRVDDAPKFEEEGLTQESTGIFDDFAAEALIIVDQIQKDLEKEDDDSQQQETESEKSVSDNTQMMEKLNYIEDPTNKSEELVKDTVSEHEQCAEQHIKEIADLILNENGEIIEAQSIIELKSVLISSIDNELPIEIAEKTSNHEVEINSESVKVLEDDEQHKNHQNAEQILEKDEEILEATQKENDKDCSPISETIANGDNKINVIGINDNDEEFIVSSNKEMPSAKDLKENAAAAEITTQDLPVRCE